MALVGALWLCGISASEAKLVLSNVSLSPTQVSLTVTGTAAPGELNSSDLDSLFFGFDNGGDNSWIFSVDGVASSALDVKNGGTYTVSTSVTNAVNGYSSLGGYLYTNSAMSIVVGTTFDYDLTWVGVFDFTGYSANDLVVQIGVTAYPPVIGGTNVLAGGVVPEPGTLALLGLGLFGLGLSRRRKTH